MLILKNAKVLSMKEPEFLGAVAVKDGKIAALGEHIPETETDEVIDLGGQYLLPGFVDAHSHIGMFEDGMQDEGNDGNECTDPLTPQLRAIDAVNPFDRCFAEAREAGVTTVVTGPGSANVVGGQFVALKTWGDCVEDMLLAFPVAMKAALGENPKNVYTEQKASPQTRMATAALLRKALIDAQEYAHKLQEAEKDDEKRPDRDLENEALLPVIQGTLPLKIHAHRADDILTGIRIAREFGIRYTLDHCTEGYLIPKHIQTALCENCCGIIVGPLLCDRSKIELRNLSMRAPKTLYDAGIAFAMMTDHPVIPQQYLSVCAALAVREGLPVEAALQSITINAARIVGLADRIGSIEPGKDADLAVFSGPPLDFMSRCKMTLINGRIVFRED